MGATISAEPAPADGQAGMRGVFAWAFVAQGFSSATNFGLTVIAGHVLGPSALGIVTVGFAGYLLVAGLQRAAVLQPTIAFAAPRSPDERRTLAEAGLTIGLAGAAAATLVVAVIGAVAGGGIGRGLLLFAPWLVPALLQEFWKAILFQEGRGAAAAASDVARFAVLAASAPALLAWRHDYVIVAGWGFGSAVGLVVALVGFPGRPSRPRPAFAAWRNRAWGLGRWLGAREVVFQVLTYATVLVLAVVIGTHNLGGLRAAEALFSPFSLLAAALVLPALPALARAAEREHGPALHLAFRICALALAIGLAYMAVMAGVGRWLLVRLFGGAFSPYRGLVWPMAASQVFSAAGVAFTLLLSAEKRGRASFVAGALLGAGTLACATGLATEYGTSGAAWGMAAGAGIGSAAVTLLAVRRKALL